MSTVSVDVTVGYESLCNKESFFHMVSHQNRPSSFRLIISFATICVTVGINVLKQSFTSEFEISRGVDLEHFRKVSHIVTLFVTPLGPVSITSKCAC
jgi:hypothetical protein